MTHHGPNASPSRQRTGAISTAPVAMLWLPRKGSLAWLVVALHRVWYSAQATAGAMLERLSVKQEVLTWLRSG